MRVQVTSRLAAPAPEADPAVEVVQSALRTPGTALPPELLAELEQRFGADLRDVRLHSDADADRATRGLRARALTVGSDILLAGGEGDPKTPKGRRLLLHEVAHAAQSPPARGAALRVAPAAEARGHEARAERAVAAHANVPAPATGTVAPGTILPLLQDTVLRPGPSGAADPYTDAIAVDIANALRSAPVGAGARAQRRLSRMPEADRTAVISRVQALLTPDQRERFASALGQAADLEAEPGTATPSPPAGEATRAPQRDTPSADALSADGDTPTADTPGADTPSGDRDAPARIAPDGAAPAGAPAATPAETARQPGEPMLAVAASERAQPATPGTEDHVPPPVGDQPTPAAPLSAPEPAGDDAAAPATVDYGAIEISTP